MFIVEEINEAINLLGFNKGIYLIHSRTTGKDYIGCTTTSFYLRWQNHLNDLIKHKHHNIKLTNIYNDFGLNDFIFIILETLEDTSNILKREKYFIEKWNPELNIGFVFQPSLFDTKQFKKEKTIGVFKKKNLYGAKIYVLNKRLLLGYFILKDDAIKAVQLATAFFTNNKFLEKSQQEQLQYVYSFYGFLNRNVPDKPLLFLQSLLYD